MSILLLTSCFQAMGWAKQPAQPQLASSIDKLSSSIDKLSSSIDGLTSGVDRLADAIRNETAVHVEIAIREHSLVALGRIESAWRALKAGDRRTATYQLDEAEKEDAAHLFYWLARVELRRQVHEASLSDGDGNSLHPEDIDKLLSTAIGYMKSADRATDHAAALEQLSVAVEFFKRPGYWPTLIQSAVTIFSLDFPGPDVDEWRLQRLAELLRGFGSEYGVGAGIEVPAALFQQIDARLGKCSIDVLDAKRGDFAQSRFSTLLRSRNSLASAAAQSELTRGEAVQMVFMRFVDSRERFIEAERTLAAIEVKILQAKQATPLSKFVSSGFFAGSCLIFGFFDLIGFSISVMSLTEDPIVGGHRVGGVIGILVCLSVPIVFLRLWRIGNREVRKLHPEKRSACAILEACRAKVEIAKKDLISLFTGAAIAPAGVPPRLPMAMGASGMTK